MTTVASAIHGVVSASADRDVAIADRPAATLREAPTGGAPADPRCYDYGYGYGRETQSGSRRYGRHLVGDLLSRWRSRRAGLLRVRHPRSRPARDLRRGLLPAVAPPAADARGARRSAGPAGRPHGRCRSRCSGCMRMLPPGDGMDMLRTLTSALSHYDADAADNSAPANYRKAVRLTAQISSLVATMGRVNASGGADSARSGAVSRRQLPLHADRRAAERARDAGVRRRAGAPRRSRAQRVDVCGARRGRDAHRHPFGDRRRRSARSRDRCTAARTPT